MSTQMITFIGIAMTIIGYLLVADWQTIPYDPCTEYSPFHHPSRFHNHSILNVEAYTTPVISYTPNALPVSLSLHSHMEISMQFGDLTTKSSLDVNIICQANNHCPLCTDNLREDHTCLLLFVNEALALENNDINYFCSFHELNHPNICVSIIHNETTNEHLLSNQAHIESFPVLPIDEYYAASNACINANVSVGECQWIPFASGEKCEDCSPICRGKQRTLLLSLYLIGMILLIGSYPLVWVTLVAIANNQSPESVQVRGLNVQPRK